MNIILDATGIYKIYKEEAQAVDVLKCLDIKVTVGEIVVIMGPSGSGKTTLLHILSGLDRPNTGTVLLDGVDLFSLSDLSLSALRNDKIGFVFQFHQLLPEFTVFENVLLPTMIGGKRSIVSTQRSMELIELVGLGGKEHRLPSQLSGGERQRVGVARALVNNPKIVFADEPSGNLDVDTSSSLHQLFLNLNNERGVTFVIATHKESMCGIANRVVELKEGKCA